ncbi:MAG TPA: LysR substrate-binding domain-containing protein, partial [Luteimonas sp.]
AEANSLTRGAELAHTSVSAASLRVKNLEERIGVKLLYRSSQGVRLSPAGQTFSHHARLVLNQLQRLAGDMSEHSKGVRGKIRICANTSAVTEFLPNVLGRFLASYPEVNIDLKERLSLDIVHILADGQTDIGIVSGEVRTEGLEVRPYREGRLVLMVAADHELAFTKDVSFCQTLDFEHVGLCEGSVIHSFLVRQAREAGRVMRFRIQVGDFEAVSRLVELQAGIAIMPMSAARRYEKHREVRVVPLTDAWSRTSLQICARSFQELPAFANNLVSMLERDTDGA